MNQLLKVKYDDRERNMGFPAVVLFCLLSEEIIQVAVKPLKKLKKTDYYIRFRFFVAV